jgi:hypothetical protein
LSPEEEGRRRKEVEYKEKSRKKIIKRGIEGKKK